LPPPAFVVDVHINSVLKIYPNPANSYFIVENDQNDELEIFDISSKKNYTKKIIKGINYIDIKNLNDGIYNVRLIQKPHKAYKVVKVNY